MNRLIDALMVNIDAEQLAELRKWLLDHDVILEEIKSDIDSVKPRIGFWDKLNVFSKTEEEIELKSYQRELKEYKKDREEIMGRMNTILLEAIDSTYAVKLKLQLAEVARQIDRLRSTGGTDGTTRRVKGKQELREMIIQLDLEHSEKFGYETGFVKEEELVAGAMTRLITSESDGI